MKKNNKLQVRINFKEKLENMKTNFVKFVFAFIFLYGALKMGIDLFYLLESFLQDNNFWTKNYGSIETPLETTPNVEELKEPLKEDQKKDKINNEQESGKGGDDFPPFPPSSPSFSFKGFMKKGDSFNIERMCGTPKWWQKKEDAEISDNERTKRVKKFLKEYIEEKEKLDKYKKEQEKIATSVHETMKRGVYRVVHKWSRRAMKIKRTADIKRFEATCLDYIIRNRRDELKDLAEARKWFLRVKRIDEMEQREKDELEQVLENILEEAYDEVIKNQKEKK